MVDPAHEIYKAPRKLHDDRFSEDLPPYMYFDALKDNKARIGVKRSAAT